MTNAKYTALALLVLLPLFAVGGNATASMAAPVRPAASTLALRVYFDDYAQRDRLASELDAEEVGTSGGYLTVLADDAKRKSLEARELRVEVDGARTSQYNLDLMSPAGQISAGGGGYKSVEENYALMDELVAKYPGLVEKVDIGDSWCKLNPGRCTLPELNAGYDLVVLRITNRNIPGPKPDFWLESGIHSREIATPEVTTRFMSFLLNGYNTDPEARWLVDYQDTWIMPHVNPDGHFIVDPDSTQPPRSQRKNADNDDGCSRYPPSSERQFGTDLNRNFPYNWGCCKGSSLDPCDQEYRGPSANSEPETQALISMLSTVFPDQRGTGASAAAPLTTTGIYQSLHSYAGINLLPWGYTTSPPPNARDLQNIGNHMTARTAFPAGNGYQSCQSSQCLYTTDGSTHDWLYGELGVPSFTTELEGTTFFPAYGRVQALWNANKGMLLYMAKIARAPYLLTRGPDAASFSSILKARAGRTALLSGRISYNWTGNLYKQNVAEAEYYIDTPPWAGGRAIPMTATDGAFNAPSEQVRALINPRGLTPGRHIIFVRGRGVESYNGNESWGPVTAVFLDIEASGQ